MTKTGFMAGTARRAGRTPGAHRLPDLARAKDAFLTADLPWLRADDGTLDAFARDIGAQGDPDGRFADEAAPVEDAVAPPAEAAARAAE